MKTKVVLLLALGAVLGACTKDEPAGSCPQVVEAPADFLAYWYFPADSYWVYRRRGSVPAVYDTVTVDFAGVDVFRPGQKTYGMRTCLAYYRLGLMHSNRTYFRGFSSFDGFGGRESLSGTLLGSGEWYVNQSPTGSTAGNDNHVWRYPAPALGEALLPDAPRLVDTLAVQVPAGTFRRSVHFYAGDFRDSARESYVRHFYLARGVGYTKLVYANLGTWELVAYRLQ